MKQWYTSTPVCLMSDENDYTTCHIKHEKETTKLRVVYDASAKSTGSSLNECLHNGPKFNQKIFNILLRFHLHKNTIVANIQKAFLMISVNEQNRDILRLLWVKDIHQEPPEIQLLRFTRVVFGVASSPFLLNTTISYHLEGYKTSHEGVIQKLQSPIYVDDVISGTKDQEAAYQFYLQAREILKASIFQAQY